MQSKDIQPGVEYAYAKSWEWKSNGYRDTRTAHKVTVLEKGVDRRYYSTTNYMYVTAKDGIRIRFDDQRGETVVQAKDIREEWATYEPAAAEALAAARRAARAEAEFKERTQARLDEIFAKMPQANRPYFTAGSAYGYKGQMTAAEVATLLEAAYAAGFEAGKADRFGTTDEQNQEN